MNVGVNTIAPGVSPLGHRSDRSWSDLLAVLVAVALLALLIDQGVQRVDPRSMSRAPTPPRAASTQPTPHVSSVSGQVLPVPGKPGALQAVDPSYRADFDAHGVRYLPAHATQPLSISLAKVTRGGRPVALHPHGWTGRASVAERRVAPGFVERATARSAAIEWDMVLSSQPAGSGNLTVTAALGGVVGAPAVVSSGGHPAVRLDVAGRTPVMLGQVVVKDATGAVLYRALPAVGAHALVVQVPGSVLESARYPLTVDPTVSSAVVVAPAGDRYNPSMAFDGSNYLVVWQEFVAGAYDIYGSIIGANGSGQLPPFRISLRPENEIVPDVAWTGFRWLVVWQDNFSGTDTDIRGQLLDAFGTAIGGETGISTPTSAQRTPSITAGNGGYLVTWSDNRNGPYEIYGSRVDSNGARLDSAGFRIDDSGGSGYQDTIPDVAWNGTKFLVVWEDKFGPLSDGSFVYQIEARVLNADASLGLTNALALFSQGIVHDPAVASNGSKFLAVWEQGSDVYGARVDPDAFNIYTGEQIPVSTASATQDDPAVTFNGGSYFVAWRDRRDFPGFTDYDVYAARVGTDGKVADPNGIIVSRFGADEDTPAVAPAPQNKWGIVYESGASGSTSINVRTAAK